MDSFQISILQLSINKYNIIKKNQIFSMRVLLKDGILSIVIININNNII